MNLVAVASNGYGNLTWQAPVSDGGSPITAYTVQYGSVGSFNLTYNAGKQLQANLPMSPGTTYNFRVYAQNAVGGGALSNVATAAPGGTGAATPAPSWTQLALPAIFTSVSIGSKTSYGGISGSSSQYYAWNGTAWLLEGIPLSQVAYGNDGDKWGVLSSGVIYRRSGASWVTVPGALKQISVGNASNVWGVNSAGSMYRWTGTGWAQVAGTWASVSVAADGSVWALQPNGSIWRWNGSSFNGVAGALRSISVGSASNVWGVNSGGAVYKFNGSGWDMPSVPSGAFLLVSTAYDGTTLLLRNDGTLWKK